MQAETEEKITIYTDGASRGNPGRAAWAYVMVRDDKVTREDTRYLGIATNNVAEYTAIISALEAALDEGYTDADLYSDSELVIRQITGVYKVRKEHLLQLRNRVSELEKQFRELTFRQVRRSTPHIALADALCNKTLDMHT